MEGQRTPNRRRTNTSLYPSTADGEGQICSGLPGEPVDATELQDGAPKGQQAFRVTVTQLF